MSQSSGLYTVADLWRDAKLSLGEKLLVKSDKALGFAGKIRKFFSPAEKGEVVNKEDNIALKSINPTEDMDMRTSSLAAVGADLAAGPIDRPADSHTENANEEEETVTAEHAPTAAVALSPAQADN